MVIALKPEERIKYDGHLILVNPFGQIPNREICDALDEIDEKRRISLLHRKFEELFPAELFCISSETGLKKEELIAKMCRDLEKKGYADHSFYPSVMGRENAFGTAFGEVAIPHSLDNNGLKTTINVCIVENGIVWDGRLLHVVFLASVNKNDMFWYREAFEGMLILLDREDFIARIRNCRNYESFQRIWMETLTKTQ